MNSVIEKDKTAHFFQGILNMQRYNSYKSDNSTFVVFDHVEQREICVCSNYDDWSDAEQRAKNIVKALNSLIIDYDESLNNSSLDRKLNLQKMKSYIFLTDEGYIFQPDVDDKLTEIDNLQVIGFAEGMHADDAYEELMAENRYLSDTSFEKVFCYQLDTDYKQNRKDYNLH